MRQQTLVQHCVSSCPKLLNDYRLLLISEWRESDSPEPVRAVASFKSNNCGTFSLRKHQLPPSNLSQTNVITVNRLNLPVQKKTKGENQI